ncbi:MAG: class I SAM-dependent methyltransferase [Pseudomonadota bacterium]
MGFSAEWLALREPVDRAARHDGLLQRAANLAGDNPVILDLGCGTGATQRAFSGLLPNHSQWRLVDNDAGLLEQACSENEHSATTHKMDLNQIEALPLDGVTLVTASALLDLVSYAWVSDLVARLNVPFYAALSYNGIMSWNPTHEADNAVVEAFNSHQCTDKGFGSALGPDAAEHSAKIFSDAGFDVETASSPWHVGPSSKTLHVELIDGIAQAASEAGAQTAKDWRNARRENAQNSNCVVGHVDLLANPANTS